MKTNAPYQTAALSALLVELGGSAPTEIKLVPAGTFRSARDNRPTDVPAWQMTDAAAEAIVAAANALNAQFLVDYDHQTLRAEQNGKPAPAAGWGGRLEWRPGDGLYAVDMDWTATAASAIAAREYRYISPVISWDNTGLITQVLMAGLTNYPALDDLTDLAAAQGLIFFPHDDETRMKALLAKLGLPEDADEAAALSAVEALQTAASQATEQVAALSAQLKTPPGLDPTRFVPIAVVTELRGQLAALSGTTKEMQVSQLIEQGVKEGKILGAQEKAWATELGNHDFAALQAYLGHAQPIAALSGMQTGGKAPVEADPAVDDVTKAKAAYSQSTALQAEFGSEATYLAYVTANQAGSVRILGAKS